jgi:putative membrane protein
MTGVERVALGVLAVATLASCVNAPFPSQMYLQHLPTAAAIGLLSLAAKRRMFSPAAFVCMVAFLLFHVIGARYIYSYVPYDRWSENLLGLNVTSYFGFRRNHYDRLVHFAFGVLAIRPVWEILTNRFKVPPRFALYASVEFVLAFSLVYELFEWGLTMVLSPSDAGAYNGEQGDLWDAHRDMSCAFIGALLALMIWRVVRRRSVDPAA